MGSYAPNKVGLYDMHGNVWQWCADQYDDPSLPRLEAGFRVARGGSWRHDAVFCRAANRGCSEPDNRSYHLGFRLVRVAVKGK